MRAEGTGAREVLTFGDDDSPRRGPASVAAAIALLAVGASAALGFEELRHGAGGENVELVAGEVLATATSTRPSDVVVQLYNHGSAEVTVLEVTPRGWTAEAESTTIPADAWGAVPVQVDVDCDSQPVPDRELVVRVATTHGSVERVVLTMSSTPYLLLGEHRRRCLAPDGTAPSLEELLGTWLVTAGWELGGHVLLQLDRDGSFRMDPELGLLTGDPGAYGWFSLEGSTLRLLTSGGRDCANGDHARLEVTLLHDGQLHLRWVEQYESSCRVEDGEVWLAQRVALPASARREPHSDQAPAYPPAHDPGLVWGGDDVEPR